VIANRVPRDATPTRGCQAPCSRAMGLQAGSVSTRRYLGAAGSLLVALALPLAVGAVGSLATRGPALAWYRSLDRPAWTPPESLFGPVWTLLYVLMGLASWRIWRRGWRRPDVRTALGVYAAHLPINALWPFVFFRWREVGLASVTIAMLLVVLGVVVEHFVRVDRLAGALLVPYVLWVGFATALNVRIWQLARIAA
jgi:translocator protein